MMSVSTAAVSPSARLASAGEGVASGGFGAELAVQSASTAATTLTPSAVTDAATAESVDATGTIEIEAEIDVAVADPFNLPAGEGATPPEITVPLLPADNPAPRSSHVATRRGSEATPPTAATATGALAQSATPISAAVSADPAMHAAVTPDVALPMPEAAAPGSPTGRLGDVMAEASAPTAAGLGVTVTPAGAASSPGVATMATAAAMPSLPVADAAPKLAEHIEAMLEDEVWSMKLRLDPPRLGTVDVQLAVRDQQVAVSLGSGDAQARMLLAQALPELANALAARGLQLMGADVGHPSQGRDEAPARRLAQSARGEGGDAEPAPTRERTRQGVVDHYA